MNERLQVGPPTPTPGIRVQEGRKKSSWNWMFCIKEWYKGEVPKFMTLYSTKTSHVTQEGGVFGPAIENAAKPVL